MVTGGIVREYFLGSGVSLVLDTSVLVTCSGRAGLKLDGLSALSSLISSKFVLSLWILVEMWLLMTDGALYCPARSWTWPSNVAALLFVSCSAGPVGLAGGLRLDMELSITECVWWWVAWL